MLHRSNINQRQSHKWLKLHVLPNFYNWPKLISVLLEYLLLLIKERRKDCASIDFRNSHRCFTTKLAVRNSAKWRHQPHYRDQWTGHAMPWTGNSSDCLFNPIPSFPEDLYYCYLSNMCVLMTNFDSQVYAIWAIIMQFLISNIWLLCGPTASIIPSQLRVNDLVACDI